MQNLPSPLENLVASFLPVDDVVALSRTSKSMLDSLALARIPMQIPFKSWYDNSAEGPQPRKGPRIPFLQSRTHSVSLSGSWSCCFGELKGKSSQNFQAQFYIVAYPGGKETRQTISAESDYYRIIWESKPIIQRHNCQSETTWVKLSASFVPKDGEDYFLCIQPGPGKTSQHHWWRYSLQMSNLVAVVYYHDEPQSNFLMRRQYQTIVKHMLQVENRRAYYTKLLEAIARSIRIQLAKLGNNALDPVLEGFFELTGIPRDTASLMALEEIARFLSQYSYLSERKKTNYKNSSGDHDSAHEGSSSHRDPSVPDWMPFAEPSVACRDDGVPRTTNTGSILSEKDQTRRRSSNRRLSLQRLQDLFVRIRGAGKAQGTQGGWNTQDVTEEMSEREAW